MAPPLRLSVSVVDLMTANAGTFALLLECTSISCRVGLGAQVKQMGVDRTMQTVLRPMESSDIPEIVRGWNLSLPYDQVDKAGFERVITDDLNYERGAALVAVHNARIVGFVGSVAREGVLGADNRGRSYEKDNGYVKGIFVLEKFRRQGMGTKLLDEAARYIESKGKNVIRVVTYTGGRYFFPGVGLEYEAAIKFFEARGFQKDRIIDDVDVEVADYRVIDYQKDAQRRMARIGVHVEDYDPSMLDEMRKFVGKINMTAWFPKGWEGGFREKGNRVAALKGKEVVGWASYHPRPGTASFGPIAVLVELRGNGIGSCLMLETLLRMKDAGVDRVAASWANTPFYLANGWKICRQYVVFEKKIGLT